MADLELLGKHPHRDALTGTGDDLGQVVLGQTLRKQTCLGFVRIWSGSANRRGSLGRTITTPLAYPLVDFQQVRAVRKVAGYVHCEVCRRKDFSWLSEGLSSCSRSCFDRRNEPEFGAVVASECVEGPLRRWSFEVPVTALP